MGQRLSDCYKKKVIAIQPAKHHKFLFGSPSSTRWTLHEHLLFQRRLCREGVAVMSKCKARGARHNAPCPTSFISIEGKLISYLMSTE